MTFRPLPARTECHVRLKRIFPRAAFDPVLANPLAATAVAAMLYVDAVVPDDAPLFHDAVWARPTTCLWMSDEAYGRTSDADRAAWRAAAGHGKRQVSDLLTCWEVRFDPWYADNTRETLRDETFPAWLRNGAVRLRPGVPTTSGKPRWALTASFADLFDPELDGEPLAIAIDAWRTDRMSPGDRLRIHMVHERDRQAYATQVVLPGGQVRSLEASTASLILKGVIEEWAPVRLGDPIVLTISEPGDKVYLADAAIMKALGISLDPSTLLPDAVIVDIAATPPAFWIIEAVASDGPIDEHRRRAFLGWADDQRIPQGSCHFLSAFSSRNSDSARRRLKDLAAGTHAWYADEPTRELSWYELDGAGSGGPVPE
ncbi:MAG TPA: BsuBI/PstI family type II restriction endonuclease [Mycobacteriales bacterium]|nr:BsuBI/PstI family type II restriction endonuclease [Mycobacteriales bacterium]